MHVPIYRKQLKLKYVKVPMSPEPNSILTRDKHLANMFIFWGFREFRANWDETPQTQVASLILCYKAICSKLEVS